MDALTFAYWLQGFAELNDGTPPTKRQWELIREHLQLVFDKKTSTYDPQEDVEEYKPEDMWKPLEQMYKPRVTCIDGPEDNYKEKYRLEKPEPDHKIKDRNDLGWVSIKHALDTRSIC